MRYEGHKTKSVLQRIIFRRCFNYQLATLYITQSFGSLWSSLELILDHPTQILEILSTELPKISVYFTTFVVARIGTSLPLLILRPWSYCQQRGEVLRCQFGAELADAALVLVIGLTYSFIAPAILPACAI